MDYVFFDLDDTLYDQVSPFALAYRDVLDSRFDLDPEALFRASRRHSDEVFAASERGEMSMDDMYVYRLQHAFEDLGVRVGASDCLAMQRAYAYNQEHAISLTPTMRSVLDWCCVHACPGIISNGPGDHQRAKMAALGLGHWIPTNAVFVSGTEGIAKPSAGLFELACRRMGTTPDRCVYVGDAFGSDVVGAVAAGMPVVWFNHRHREAPSSPSPDWEVQSEEELLELLPRIATTHPGAH